jgi:mannose-6-phosphate isomerase-like protein (cupin superfamily)
MSRVTNSDPGAVLVRAADAERIGFPPQTVRLLADSPATGGKLSAQRVTLQGGADGANRHHRASSAELFYVLSGSAQLLAGDRLLLAGEGDLAIVPPGLPRASPSASASASRGRPTKPGRNPGTCSLVASKTSSSDAPATDAAAPDGSAIALRLQDPPRSCWKNPC